MNLEPHFPNGPFGDPALLLLHPQKESGALLFDCGDLTHFTLKQLIKVDFIFISHCHMDHFLDFDTYLRVHMGLQKTVTLFGPPDTSKRVGAKLQSYTWNLIQDQNLEFIVIDLEFDLCRKKITHFHSKDSFLPSLERFESWNPSSTQGEECVIRSKNYTVRAGLLDHHTPSLCYCVEQDEEISINPSRMKELHLMPGPWIREMKSWTMLPNEEKKKKTKIKIIDQNANFQEYDRETLSKQILLKKMPFKVGYATDGAAHETNRKTLIKLMKDVDWFFAETCFLQKDFQRAQATKHFTAQFIAETAQEAKVKRLSPFHFSKRYKGQSVDALLKEMAQFYSFGEIIFPYLTR